MNRMNRFLLLAGMLTALASPAWSQCVLRQATASQEISIGPFLDDVDGNSEETGLTIANTDIRIKKGAADWAAKNSGGGTAEEHGNYRATLDATDSSAVGILEIYVHISGALPVWKTCEVLTANTWDALFGVTYLNVNISALTNGVITAAKIDNDVVTLLQTGLYGLRKNVASQTFHFWMFDSTTGLPKTGLSTAAITCQISKDAAAYATTNDTTELEIGLGEYWIALTQLETAANDVSIACNAANSKQAQATAKPQR